MYYAVKDHFVITNNLSKFSCIALAKISAYCFTWFNNTIMPQSTTPLTFEI